MKKSFAVFLGLALAAICQFALAAPAYVSELTGTAQATPATGASRALKKGDSVNELDTIQTGDQSGLVLIFEDGQIAAVGANSRMKVSAYSYYVKEPAKSNVLLSLLTGGMRAITGLIGKSRPDKVSYVAGTATIGIRGTDVLFGTGPDSVGVKVIDGEITFFYFVNGVRTEVPVQAGGAVLKVGNTLTRGDFAAIDAAIQRNPVLKAALEAMSSVDSQFIRNAVQKALTTTLNEEAEGDTTHVKPAVTCGVSCS